MKPFVLYVTEKNKKKGTVSPTERQLYALSVGYAGNEEFDVVEVRVQVTNELVFTWHQTYSHLLKDVTQPHHDFPVYSFMPIKRQMEKDALNNTFMTQEEIAAHFQIHQCRVSELKRYEFLKPSHKEGNTEFYRKGDVLGLLENPHFVASLRNSYERNRA